MPIVTTHNAAHSRRRQRATPSPAGLQPSSEHPRSRTTGTHPPRHQTTGLTAQRPTSSLQREQLGRERATVPQRTTSIPDQEAGHTHRDSGTSNQPSERRDGTTRMTDPSSTGRDRGLSDEREAQTRTSSHNRLQTPEKRPRSGEGATAPREKKGGHEKETGPNPKQQHLFLTDRDRPIVKTRGGTSRKPQKYNPTIDLPVPIRKLPKDNTTNGH